jgi:hypothetical protein
MKKIDNATNNYPSLMQIMPFSQVVSRETTRQPAVVADNSLPPTSSVRLISLVKPDIADDAGTSEIERNDADERSARIQTIGSRMGRLENAAQPFVDSGFYLSQDMQARFERLTSSEKEGWERAFQGNAEKLYTQRNSCRNLLSVIGKYVDNNFLDFAEKNLARAEGIDDEVLKTLQSNQMQEKHGTHPPIVSSDSECQLHTVKENEIARKEEILARIGFLENAEHRFGQSFGLDFYLSQRIQAFYEKLSLQGQESWRNTYGNKFEKLHQKRNLCLKLLHDSETYVAGNRLADAEATLVIAEKYDGELFKVFLHQQLPAASLEFSSQQPSALVQNEEADLTSVQSASTVANRGFVANIAAPPVTNSPTSLSSNDQAEGRTQRVGVVAPAHIEATMEQPYRHGKNHHTKRDPGTFWPSWR